MEILQRCNSHRAAVCLSVRTFRCFVQTNENTILRSYYQQRCYT